MLSSIPTSPCSSPLLDLMRLARCGLRTSRASHLSVLAAPILRGDQLRREKKTEEVMVVVDRLFNSFDNIIEA